MLKQDKGETAIEREENPATGGVREGREEEQHTEDAHAQTLHQTNLVLQHFILRQGHVDPQRGPEVIHLALHQVGRQQRDHCVGSHGDVRRGAEDQVDQDGEEGGVEAVDRFEGGQNTEAKSLRQLDEASGEAADDVCQHPLAPFVAPQKPKRTVS